MQGLRFENISAGVQKISWIIGGESNERDDKRFSKEHGIGCVLVGLGFGVPTIVYRKENLPMPIRVLIHMGIGCVIYTIVAYAVGWIGGSATITQGIIIAVIQLAVAFLIWFLFMRYYRAEAKKMNDRIQELK